MECLLFNFKQLSDKQFWLGYSVLQRNISIKVTFGLNIKIHVTGMITKSKIHSARDLGQKQGNRYGEIPTH